MRLITAMFFLFSCVVNAEIIVGGPLEPNSGLCQAFVDMWKKHDEPEKPPGRTELFNQLVNLHKQRDAKVREIINSLAATCQAVFDALERQPDYSLDTFEGEVYRLMSKDPLFDFYRYFRNTFGIDIKKDCPALEAKLDELRAIDEKINGIWATIDENHWGYFCGIRADLPPDIGGADPTKVTCDKPVCATYKIECVFYPPPGHKAQKSTTTCKADACMQTVKTGQICVEGKRIPTFEDRFLPHAPNGKFESNSCKN